MSTSLQANPLPEAVARRGLDESQWLTLQQSLFPGAKPESILMVIDYCKARRLDPMKKPCHLVPVKVKDAKSGNYEWRDVVMPGIYEYRTTAMRTGVYHGHSEPEYGPVHEVGGVPAPEWCAMTFYRQVGAETVPFPVRVYFREVVGMRDGKANDRWARAPFQMLTKCCEAAGLREAFPDEFGGEPTAEEMTGQEPIDVTPAAPVKAALRLSQQPTPPEGDPDAARALAPVGLIVKVEDRSQGGKTAAAIILDGGFVATTRDPEIIAVAQRLEQGQTRVELVTETSKTDPSRYAPKVIEIVVLETGEGQG